MIMERMVELSTWVVECSTWALNGPQAEAEAQIKMAYVTLHALDSIRW